MLPGMWVGVHRTPIDIPDTSSTVLRAPEWPDSGFSVYTIGIVGARALYRYYKVTYCHN